MTDKTQPEALRLAEQYDYGDPAAHSNTWKVAVCTELRRQHARISELEAQLEAIGAGGVQALSAAPAVKNSTLRTYPNPIVPLIKPVSEQEKMRALYLASSNLMAYLGRNGAIHSDGHAADVLMNCLNDLDGGEFDETLFAASPTPPAEQPEDEGISREQWIDQAVRVYLIAGDTEDQALECAAYLWGELDMDDLADPYDAAMSDIEGRGPVPQAAPKAAPGAVSDTQHSQFLSDVLTAAGLITHGKQCKALGARLSDMVTRLRAAPQQEAQEPVAWESTILGYIKYITQSQYEKFRPNVRRWYKPYKCSNCSAPQPAPEPLSERDGWLSQDDMTALERVDECFEDGEGYDVPKARMKRLAELGVVQSLGFAKYDITSFGRYILGSDHLRKPLETVDECNTRLGREHHARRAALAAQGGA